MALRGGKGHTLEEVDRFCLKKRRRISGSEEVVWAHDDETIAKYHDPCWDGCITLWNNKTFLADVNWELAKLG